jgi:hypothetical protein
MGRALQRQAPQGHMTAFITQGEADVLRSLGGGVSPNGGQIMRNGIPSFQYAFIDDIEQGKIAQEQVQAGRTLQDFEDEALQAEQEARWHEEQNRTNFAEQARKAKTNARPFDPASFDERSRSREYQPYVSQFVGVPGFESQISSVQSPLNQQTSTGQLPEAEELSDSYMPVDQSTIPGELSSNELLAQQIANNPAMQRATAGRRQYTEKDNYGLVDNLLNFGKILANPGGALFGVAKNYFSPEARAAREQSNVRYRNQGQEWDEASTPEEYERLMEIFSSVGNDPYRNISPEAKMYFNRKYERDIAQEAQEEQQADLDRQLTNELSNAITDPSIEIDYPDGAPPLLTPEEDARRGRVRQKINEMPDWQRKRLGLKFTGKSLPYTSGSGFETPALTPAPSGFQEPATFISPGAYPDVFVNDMTGERFEAPSLGYVPPSGWRRV